jgi:hypothetical protein
MSRLLQRAPAPNAPSSHASPRARHAPARQTTHPPGMTPINREARDGIMRAWLEILRERHPDVTWIPTPDESGSPQSVSASEPDRAATPI